MPNSSCMLPPFEKKSFLIFPEHYSAGKFCSTNATIYLPVPTRDRSNFVPQKNHHLLLCLWTFHTSPDRTERPPAMRWGLHRIAPPSPDSSGLVEDNFPTNLILSGRFAGAPFGWVIGNFENSLLLSQRVLLAIMFPGFFVSFRVLRGYYSFKLQHSRERRLLMIFFFGSEYTGKGNPLCPFGPGSEKRVAADGQSPKFADSDAILRASLRSGAEKDGVSCCCWWCAAAPDDEFFRMEDFSFFN